MKRLYWQATEITLSYYLRYEEPGIDKLKNHASWTQSLHGFLLEDKLCKPQLIAIWCQLLGCQGKKHDIFWNIHVLKRKRKGPSTEGSLKYLATWPFDRHFMLFNLSYNHRKLLFIHSFCWWENWASGISPNSHLIYKCAWFKSHFVFTT